MARRAVLVTATEPEPRSFGKQVVLGGILDHLVTRLGPDDVHVVLLGEPAAPRPATPYVLHVLQRPSSREQAASVVRRVLGPPHTSLQEAALFAPRLREQLQATLAGIGADLEVWDTVRTGQYAAAGSGARRLLYADDLFSERYAALLRLSRTAAGAHGLEPAGEFGRVLPAPLRTLLARRRVYRPLLALEQHLVARAELGQPRRFDGTLLVSEDEAGRLRARTGRTDIRSLTPLLPTAAHTVRQYRGGTDVVFLGSFDYAPNRDGLAWFLRECRTQVLARVPDLRLRVVGKGTEAGLPEADAWGDRVSFLGWVDDLQPELSRAAALLSPLRVGTGVKIKVLEALARGLPVVGTSAGVQGLGPDLAGAIVAEDPDGLAAALAQVVDPVTNARLSEAASRTWASRFAADVVGRDYDEVFGLHAGTR